MGDKKAAIDAVIDDARERGITCRITGMTGEDKQTFETLYPERFTYKNDRDFYDYVYSIDDLAELKGKKYHGKKGHYRKFCDRFKGFVTELITEENVPLAREMLTSWYAERETSDAYYSFDMERAAIARAFESREALGVIGFAIRYEDRILAFAMASRMSHDTFDIHFEKAVSDADGAYAAINCEFAKYIRENSSTGKTTWVSRDSAVQRKATSRTTW